ncbi:MAG: site-specific integrase [Clostridia bacterium]|nr:site-specific integrase [Clostridia bacterium]
MISAKFEDEIWIYFQTNLSTRTRKEYWNVVKNFDKVIGHDPMKLTRKEAREYYNYLIERVNLGKLTYNTAVMRLSVMRSVCTFIETYIINHGRKYTNYFDGMSLPEQDKILNKDSIPNAREIDNLLSAALDNNDNKAFLIFSLVIKMGLTNQEICSLDKEFICRDSDNNLCFNMPPKNHIRRFICIPEDIAGLLDTYIKANNIQSGAIFLNMRKTRIKMRDTERMLALYTERLVKQRQLRRHYTMQTLRHAAISYMLLGGATKEETAAYTGVTGKWMNRYDKIVPKDIISSAGNYNIISIKQAVNNENSRKEEKL